MSIDIIIFLSIFIGWIAIMSYCICGMVALANGEKWGFKHWFERVGGELMTLVNVSQLKECYELLKEIDKWDYAYPSSTQYRLDLMLCKLSKKFEREVGNTLTQEIFEGHDRRYKFASVVKGKAQLMTHSPVEKKDSFGREYLSYPIDTFIQPLEGDFENTDFIIERIER